MCTLPGRVTPGTSPRRRAPVERCGPDESCSGRLFPVRPAASIGGPRAIPPEYVWTSRTVEWETKTRKTPKLRSQPNAWFAFPGSRFQVPGSRFPSFRRPVRLGGMGWLGRTAGRPIWAHYSAKTLLIYTGSVVSWACKRSSEERLAESGGCVAVHQVAYLNIAKSLQDSNSKQLDLSVRSEQTERK